MLREEKQQAPGREYLPHASFVARLSEAADWRLATRLHPIVLPGDCWSGAGWN